MIHPLTPRQHKILWATVRSYVATAEPVGSKTLASAYNLGVSTATIRHDLAALEQIGLLFQPHTSAGRVPSDSGYRVYVNHLLDLQSMALGAPSVAEQQEILQRLTRRLEEQLGGNLDSMLMRAAKILANLSGCIALVSAPQTHIVTIRHLQLVVVDPQRVMVILVTDSYQTHSLLVNLSSGDAADSQSGQIPPLPISAESLEEELQVLSNFLNLKLRGKTFAQLQDVSWLELDREFRSYAVWLQQLFKGITQKVLKSCSTQLFAAGVNELMRQPEFSQTHQMQAVIQLLEEDPGALEGVISPNPSGQVTIYIGMENPLQPIRHCTLISSTYYRGPDPLGSVSLLGPTRMVYEKAISSVQRVADYLSNTLAS